MNSPVRDFRFAVRILARSPWFTGLAALTLALGIGANTALYSLLDAVLLRGLPYKEPDRLVAIAGQEGDRTSLRVPVPLVEAMRERALAIEAMSIENPAGAVLRTQEGPVRVHGRRVSSNFVELMGISPLAGRGFVPDEENPGAPAAMVISFGLWQRHLGGDPEVVGRTLYLGGTHLEGIATTVVGVMPPEFRDYLGSRVDFWTAYASEQDREHEREIGHELIARLAPGVTPEEAQLELETIATSMEVAGWGQGGRRFAVKPLKDEIVGDSAYALQLLLAAVAVVLVIACANLAQLLLARSDRRVSEFATRKAIGASAYQLFRLALVESLLLSLAGGACGVALAFWLLPVMLALAPSEIPRITEAAIDGRVLLGTIGLTLLAGCGFGLAPALRLSLLSVVEAMKHGPGIPSSGRRGLRSALVVGQVTTSVALFVLAGLIGRTFLTLLPTDPGFEADSRTVLYVSLPPDLYPNRGERVRLWENLLERVEALPGIRMVGLGENVPFGDDDREVFAVADLNRGESLDGVVPLKADRRVISPNYFQLLQMPLVRGRIFTSGDRAESRGVAIVNETLARRLAPGGDVLGRRVQVQGAPLPAYEIVGVVANARSVGTSTEIWNEIYIPYAQSRVTFAFLIVRSELDSGALDPMLRKEIRAWAPEAPNMPWLTATSMEVLMSRSLAEPRFSATLIGVFSAMALLLAAIGVFGLVAYSVSHRLKEFGIRAALGARPRDLLSISMRSAVTLALIGVLSGLVAAAYLTRFIESQLYGIERLDPLTFLGTGVVMFFVAGLAAYLPARRAAHVDPLTALRYE